MKRSLPGFVLTALLLCSTPVKANNATFLVFGEAQAQISTALNTITITLTDLYVDPSSVGQNLSAFIFSLSNTPTSASLTSSSATQVTVQSPEYTMGSAAATGWTLALMSATTTLDVLTGAGPAHTIIGAPGSEGYGNANGSLTSGPHNPFLYEFATFTLNEAGVTAATNVTSAVFQFGTTDGSDRVAGTLAAVATPEPSTLAMLGCTGVLIALWKTRRRAFATPDRRNVPQHLVDAWANRVYRERRYGNVPQLHEEGCLVTKSGILQISWPRMANGDAPLALDLPRRKQRASRSSHGGASHRQRSNPDSLQNRLALA